MSVERANPGTVRPGGRTARVRESVLQAAGNALVEHGFANLDLGDVAHRAAVGRTTVYRRWGTVNALIADLLTDMAETSQPRADTGSLLGDLQANARLVQQTLTDPRQGTLFRAVIAAATCDAATAEALHRFYQARIAEWAPCVTRAIERGELLDDTDPDEVVKAVSAPLYYRMLASGEPLDQAAADRAADAAAAAARAGAYRRRTA
jgi:AcrR family transcriptional regulator